MKIIKLNTENIPLEINASLNIFNEYNEINCNASEKTYTNKNNIEICTDCFLTKNISSTAFLPKNIFMTEKRELEILAAIELHGDKWSKISAECNVSIPDLLFHFLKLDCKEILKKKIFSLPEKNLLIDEFFLLKIIAIFLVPKVAFFLSEEFFLQRDLKEAVFNKREMILVVKRFEEDKLERLRAVLVDILIKKVLVKIDSLEKLRDRMNCRQLEIQNIAKRYRIEIENILKKVK